MCFLEPVLVSIENQITSTEGDLAGYEKVRLVTSKVDCGARVNGCRVGAAEEGKCHFLTPSPVSLTQSG